MSNTASTRLDQVTDLLRSELLSCSGVESLQYLLSWSRGHRIGRETLFRAAARLGVRPFWARSNGRTLKFWRLP